MDNLKHLLKKIDILNQRIKDREEHKDNFNLFDLMLKRDDEVHLHSRFLSILFDPHGSHKMKDTFIRLFIEKLNLPFEYNLSSLEVYPNEKNTCEYKKIDILLMDRKRRSAVIIENKIGAKDSNHEEEGQIERYYRIITNDEGIPAESTSVIYLSINRDSPSDESVATSGQFPELEDKVLNIHYGVEILDWLKSCCKECYNRPILRESITQYIKLIENMTNNETSEEDLKSLMSLVGENNNNLLSAKRLIDNSRNMHYLAISEFWKLLSKKFVNAGFSIRQDIKKEMIDALVHGQKYKRNKAHVYLKLATPDKINFTINADCDYYIHIGIMDNDLKTGLKRKTKTFFLTNHDTLKLYERENWTFIKLIEFKGSKGLWLHNFSEELTFRLISESHRNKVTDIIIKQTKDLLECYRKCIK